MSFATAVVAAGVWPALPVTGGWLLRRYRRRHDGLSFPAGICLDIAAGLVAWSLPLLGLALAGVFRPEYHGAAGWVVTLVGVLRPGRAAAPASRPLGDWLWDVILATGLLGAGGCYFAFPTESILGGADQGVYANHAVWIARHGCLNIPYPCPIEAARAAAAPDGYFLPGFYRTEPTITVQFGHLFPVWLAQAFASFGPGGLFRLNGALAVVSLGIFYGLCRRALPRSYAAAATLFLAFNPSELWLARITLSEVLTQLFVGAGVCCLVLALGGDQGLAHWAGVFFGMSALVRLDALVLIPLLFLSHAAWETLRPADPSDARRVWPGLYAAALPLFGLAIAYYATASRPYMLGLQPQLRAIAALGAAGLAVLLLSHSRPGKRLRPWLASPPARAAAGVAFIAVGIAAYAARPALDPGLPDSWSLVNLGRYLSPPLLFTALFGGAVTLSGVGRDRPASLVALLLIWVGFSALYLWRPSVDPIHFWGIRRYVPVVIPGFVLFGGVGGRCLIGRLPARPRRWAEAGAVLALAAFTLRADRPILFFAENAGLYGQYQAFADRIPPAELVLACADGGKVTPLWTAFGRRLLPIDPGAADACQVLRERTRRELAECHPAYVVAEDLILPGAVELARLPFKRLHSEETWNPLPRRIVTARWTFRLYRVDSPPTPADYLGVALGRERACGVAESGFYRSPKIGAAGPVRWTDGTARLLIPVDPERPPRSLRLELAAGDLAGGPADTSLRVSANGREMYRGPVPRRQPWTWTVDLAGVDLGSRLTLELTNPPAEDDGLPFGVLVRGVWLLAEPPEPGGG
jgi:hypothetical protein